LRDSARPRCAHVPAGARGDLSSDRPVPRSAGPALVGDLGAQQEVTGLRALAEALGLADLDADAQRAQHLLHDPLLHLAVVRGGLLEERMPRLEHQHLPPTDVLAAVDALVDGVKSTEQLLRRVHVRAHASAWESLKSSQPTWCSP